VLAQKKNIFWKTSPPPNFRKQGFQDLFSPLDRQDFNTHAHCIPEPECFFLLSINQFIGKHLDPPPLKISLPTRFRVHATLKRNPPVGHPTEKGAERQDLARFFC
jgi:hypothetical protein